ncbi:MAG: heparan-alpha-glucosaminide N-acetyltransferase [Veillonellales bacterium]
MKPHHRIWEIDFARGLAILLMILFHLIVDLKDFYGFPLEYLSGFWYFEGKLSAILFIFLAGISCVLSKRTLTHGLKIFSWGMVLTIITYYYNPYTFIRFGILHLIGSSILSYKLLNGLSSANLLVSSLIVLFAGNKISAIGISTGCLLPLGLTPPGFQAMDYYPLLPWYGVFLLGVVTGRRFYANRSSLLPFFLHPAIITVPGRYSLLIYLIHQPLLLIILYCCHLVLS